MNMVRVSLVVRALYYLGTFTSWTDTDVECEVSSRGMWSLVSQPSVRDINTL